MNDYSTVSTEEENEGWKKLQMSTKFRDIITQIRWIVSPTTFHAFYCLLPQSGIIYYSLRVRENKKFLFIVLIHTNLRARNEEFILRGMFENNEPLHIINALQTVLDLGNKKVIVSEASFIHLIDRMETFFNYRQVIVI